MIKMYNIRRLLYFLTSIFLLYFSEMILPSKLLFVGGWDCGFETWWVHFGLDLCNYYYRMLVLALTGHLVFAPHFM